MTIPNLAGGMKAGGVGRGRLLVVAALTAAALAGCIGSEDEPTGETGPVASPPAGPSGRPAGALELIAPVPEPGEPAGVAFRDGLAYVSTFGVARGDPDQFIFVIDVATKSVRGTILVPAEAPASTMGLMGLSFGPDDALYAVDMNGRILRVVAPWDPANATLTVWARWPQSAVGPVPAPMPMDVAFASDGRAYVGDSALPVIWRVGATGSPVERWLQDPRLSDVAQLRVVGDEAWYISRDFARGDGTLFRIPLRDVAKPEEAVVVHEWRESGALGFVRGPGNRTYVSHAVSNEVSVLDDTGQEVKRFPTPAGAEVPFDYPMHLAFDGDGRLLVANNAWKSLRADHMALLALTVAD